MVDGVVGVESGDSSSPRGVPMMMEIEPPELGVRIKCGGLCGVSCPGVLGVTGGVMLGRGGLVGGVSTGRGGTKLSLSAPESSIPGSQVSVTTRSSPLSWGEEGASFMIWWCGFSSSAQDKWVHFNMNTCVMSQDKCW